MPAVASRQATLCWTSWSLLWMSIGCGSDVLRAVRCARLSARARRGVRHQMTTILGLALCAVLAGARSFTAIGE